MANTVKRTANVFAVGEMRLIDKEQAKLLLFAEKKRYTGGLKGNSLHRAIPAGKEAKYTQFVSDLGVSPSSPEWANAVRQYWANFTDFIPFGELSDLGKVVGGKEINASYTEEEDGSISVENLKDFCLYEMMMNDNYVATSPDLYEQKSQFAFFCIDSAIENQKSKELTAITEKAIIEFSKLLMPAGDGKDNTPQLKAIAAFMDNEISGIHAKAMDRTDAISSIKKVMDKTPQKLLDAIADTSLKFKVLVRQAVEAGAISLNGLTYYYQNEQIGNELDMIAFLKDPNNDNDLKKVRKIIEEFVNLGVAV